jgi:hypothetical protein
MREKLTEAEGMHRDARRLANDEVGERLLADEALLLPNWARRRRPRLPRRTNTCSRQTAEGTANHKRSR